MNSDMQSPSSTPTAPWRDFRQGFSTASSGYTSPYETNWLALPPPPTYDSTEAYRTPSWDKQERAHRFNKVLFRSLHFTVRITTRSSPHDRYLEAEKGRDNNLMEYLDTDDGQATLAKVFSQYPGLEKTIKTASDVGWFLREACTPGSYLHRLLDDMLTGEAHPPPLSLWQYVHLALLTSPTRRLGLWQIPCAIASICKRWSDAKQDDELRHWIHQTFGIAHSFSDDSCELIASPHDNLVVRHNPVANGAGMIACEAISIRAGEEYHFFTRRWSDGLHQHFHAPPYNAVKRYPDQKTKVPADINRLPPEIMLQILGYVASFDGLIVLDFDAHQRRFECNWFLQGLQAPLSPSKDWEHAHKTTKTFLKTFLDLRFVNKKWSVQVMEALFESRSIMFQQDGAPNYEDTFTDEQMTCFVPWRGDNNSLTDLDVAVQYQIAFQPNQDSHTVSVACAQDVFSVSNIRGKGHLHSCLSRYYGDQASLTETWLISSLREAGLQIRGFSIVVAVKGVQGITHWKRKVQHFVWKLMTDPSSLPKVGNKHVLDLGRVWEK